MSRRLGSLGCSPVEARERLKRLLDMGLKGAATDLTIPLADKARTFIKDMIDVLRDNPDFEPSPGQVFYAQDLYDRYIV